MHKYCTHAQYDFIATMICVIHVCFCNVCVLTLNFTQRTLDTCTYKNVAQIFLVSGDALVISQSLTGCMFVESFQGQYKDGTNGTGDFRMVSASFPILRMLILGSFMYRHHLTSDTFSCFHAITKPY